MAGCLGTTPFSRVAVFSIFYVLNLMLIGCFRPKAGIQQFWLPVADN